MTTLTIQIDGNEVSLTGSRKGDGVYEALKGTAWKWSRPTDGFVLPRNLLPHTRDRNVQAAKAKLEAAGFEVEVEDTGTVLSVAEEREQSEQRLAERAERYEHTAERSGAEAQRRWEAERAILDPIPVGQPILVGHHSEGRHRRALERADNHMRKGLEALRESEQAAERAANIKRSLANGTPQVTLLRRIERYETEIRDYDRKLNGTSVAMSYGKPATGEWRERLLTLRERAQEALDLDRAELARRAEEEGVKVWTREDFQKGDEVAFRYGWTRVLRVNAKSVTIPHIMDALAEHGHTWTLPYAEIKGRRRDGEVTK